MKRWIVLVALFAFSTGTLAEARTGSPARHPRSIKHLKPARVKKKAHRKAPVKTEATEAPAPAAAPQAETPEKGDR